MKAIILAAGYATRLYPLTINTPKALLDIGGRPMLDYLLKQISEVPGISEAHIITNHRFFSQFQEYAVARNGCFGALRLSVWDDETTSDDDKRGAIGDIQYVIEKARLDDDMLICASDNFFTFPLTDFVDSFKRTGLDTLLMGRVDDIDTLRAFAVATLGEDGRVLGLVEKPSEPPTDIGVYALYLYRRDTLPLIDQYLAEGNSPDSPGHFPEWLYKRRDVRGYVFDGECIDIGTPRMYEEVCNRFAEGI